MRRAIALTTLMMLAACTARSTTPSATSAASSATVLATGVASTPLPPTASPSPVLPEGMPPSFNDDVPAGNVPVAALIPLDAEVTGSWYGRTYAGEAIVIAWQVPGKDPFRLDRGLAVWRHFDDGGEPWRPVFGTAYPAAHHPVLNLAAQIGDVTADGSDDALVLAETGGSGACGTYEVIDLASGRRIFDRNVCDTTIEPSTSPVGLVTTEAVYRHGDPHCCPSATRVTILSFAGDAGWDVVSRTTTPT